MKFYSYKIIHLEFISQDTFIIKVKPTDNKTIFNFQPGQYTHIKNPKSSKPNEFHTFSFASSPTTKGYLEFCIKIYGEWTTELSQTKEGDILEIADPEGEFIWKPEYPNVVFLAGGLGISPIISMIRYIQDNNHNPHLTLLYGNRTEETIAYKKELNEIQKKLSDLKIVHILSHLQPEDAWKGYRGFITDEIIKKEVNIANKPIFFIIGPPVFIEKMTTMLKEFSVEEDQIKLERL